MLECVLGEAMLPVCETLKQSQHLQDTCFWHCVEIISMPRGQEAEPPHKFFCLQHVSSEFVSARLRWREGAECCAGASRSAQEHEQLETVRVLGLFTGMISRRYEGAPCTSGVLRAGWGPRGKNPRPAPAPTCLAKAGRQVSRLHGNVAGFETFRAVADSEQCCQNNGILCKTPF